MGAEINRDKPHVYVRTGDTIIRMSHKQYFQYLRAVSIDERYVNPHAFGIVHCVTKDVQQIDKEYAKEVIENNYPMYKNRSRW